MDLVQLAYFQAVARLEHVSDAATELGITQPSLSRAIKRLELELGVPLFDRHGRGIRLNQFGAAYLRRVDDVLRELDGAAAEIGELAGLHRGVVSLAAASLVWLPALVKPFLASHPGVQFQLFQRSMVEMRQLLDDGAVDLCVLPPTPTNPTVRWRRLGAREIFLVVPRGHRFAARSSVELRHVAEENLILGKPGDVLRETMDAYFQQAGFRPRVVCEADEPGAAVEAFVLAGVGITFLPDTDGIWGRSKDLCNVRLSPACILPLSMAWNERRSLSLAAREFRTHAFAHFDAAAAADNRGKREPREPSVS